MTIGRAGDRMMEERLRQSALFDLYGALLTDKQQRCLTMHLFEDLSLSEIGEALGISRQAVHDTLRRAEQTLEEYEARLGLLARQRREQMALDAVYDGLARLSVTDATARDELLRRLEPFTSREVKR